MMRFSICIPVYNFDVRQLVSDLRKQISLQNLSAEIILIDDRSDNEFLSLNSEIQNIVDLYVKLDHNIGRSKIRNLFLKYACGEYLLFLDCDGKITTEDFVINYIKFIENKKTDVVFGGRIVDKNEPCAEFGLRWRFAVERENLPVEARKKSPYLYFQSNNFVVKRSVLAIHPFNETIAQYGYEDLIFAKDLHNAKIKIYHIDNPVFNGDVETNAVFLKKTDSSARSMAHLIKTDIDLQKNPEIKLAKAYFLLKKKGGIFVYDLIYRLTKPYIERKLLSGKASLKILDLYKLGQLISYMKKS